MSGRALISIYISCLLLERRDDSHLTQVCFSAFVVPQLLELTDWGVVGEWSLDIYLHLIIAVGAFSDFTLYWDIDYYLYKWHNPSSAIFFDLETHKEM